MKLRRPKTLRFGKGTVDPLQSLLHWEGGHLGLFMKSVAKFCLCYALWTHDAFAPVPNRASITNGHVRPARKQGTRQ